MKIKTNRIENNENLQGIVIEDLNTTQVKAVDALILAENGIVVPEQNIYYNDEDITYDPDFDEVEWSKEPIRLSWEEKIELAKQLEESKEEISFKIRVSDQEVRKWIYDNYDKMGAVLEGFVVNIYKANKIISSQDKR